MLNIDVVLLPQFLAGGDLAEETVVVFDVLRATSTITMALEMGIADIRVFETPALARAAAESVSPRPILCGEINTLPPPGFDLGNSPGQFLPEHAGHEVYLSTTNGTRALLAARSAAKLFAGSLLNASAVARAAASTNKPVVLLCSGSSGEISIEDTLGAGAVCDSLLKLGGYCLEDDTAQMAHRLFLACRDDLPSVLREAHAGRNIRRAKLDADIDFCAHLNALDVVGAAASDPSGVVIRRFVCNLADQIASAFRDTPAPGESFGDISATPQDEGIVEYFRGTTWRGHTVANLRHHSAALSFFTDRAFRYWLPAFMLASLEDENKADVIPSSILFHMREKERMALFTSMELRAIAAFLHEFAERYDDKEFRIAGETVSIAARQK